MCVPHGLIFFFTSLCERTVELMLTDKVDWSRLRAEVTYVKTDSLAELRTAPNKIESHPVYMNGAGDYFLRLNGSWFPVDDLKMCNMKNPHSTGFLRFVKIPPKKYFNPLQNKMVEVQ